MERTGSGTVWAMHDGKIGMANQVLGLADAVGFPCLEKRLAIGVPWRYLPPQLWLKPLAAARPGGAALAPPWPDLLIACGRLTVAPARAIKRASGGAVFWVQVQDPRWAQSEVDLIVAPAHDPAKSGNVFRTLGAVHRVTPVRLAAGAQALAPRLAQVPRPLVAVLIGGDNRVYRLGAARLKETVDQLKGLADQGFGIALTPSRRTAPEVRHALAAGLGGRAGAWIWDGEGDNPYFGLLGLADAIVVTADSVNMVSEAAATGKPVHILELDGGSAKFARFHKGMEEAGVTRPFRGRIERWSYAPPDDTARAAAQIRAGLARRHGRAA